MQETARASKRTILFVTYGGGHVDIVLRLLPHLTHRPDLEVKVLALTTAAPRLAAAGYTYLDCKSFLPHPAYAEAMNLGAKLSKDIWEPSVGISWEDSCAYLGISMCDLIEKEGRDTAFARYSKEGRSAFCPENFINHVLIHEKVDLVVTTAHVRMERAAVLAANELGIATVRVDDLLGYSILGPYGAGIPRKLLPQQEWPAYVSVFNDEVKKRIIDEGFPENRVYPFGQPVFSEWQAHFQSRPITPKLADWRSAKRPIIVYAGTSIADVFFFQLQQIIDLARKNSDWGLCIKIHPSIGVQSVIDRHTDLPDNIRILSNEDILEVIRAANVVIITNSTVGFLCVFNNIPLIVFNNRNSLSEDPLVVNSAAAGVDNVSELEQVLAIKLKEDPTRAQLEKPRLFENPPKASERIAEWMYRIAWDEIALWSLKGR